LACALSLGAYADNRPTPEFNWQLPPGFPPPHVPADNPMSEAKVALGKRLFFDTRLSSTGNYSCGSCHRPEWAFTDGRVRAVGASGELLPRSAMSLANVAYSPALTWANPRISTLEAQMRTPLFSRHPLEMGLAADGHGWLASLSSDCATAQQFAMAFPGDEQPVSVANTIKAIAAFERTLISGRSPFDRYVFSDDSLALSESAKRGMSLFFSPRAACSACHSGINFSGPLIYQDHTKARAFYANNGLGRFKVPTLRNISLTATYMHDGRLATLAQVVDYYSRGGNHSPKQDTRVHALHLSAAEDADLLAFLDSLSDRDFVANTQFRP
jgi:cytochrome c peroxidase